MPNSKPIRLVVFVYLLHDRSRAGSCTVPRAAYNTAYDALTQGSMNQITDSLRPIVEGGIVVEIAGNQNRLKHFATQKLGAACYINIDPFYNSDADRAQNGPRMCGWEGFIMKPDRVNSVPPIFGDVVWHDYSNETRPPTLDRRGTPSVAIREDALVGLLRIPDGTVRCVTVNAFDDLVTGNQCTGRGLDDYHERLAQEVNRVLPVGGVVFGVTSTLISHLGDNFKRMDELSDLLTGGYCKREGGVFVKMR